MLSGEEPLKAKQPSNGEFFEPSSHAQAAKIQSQEGVSIPQCSENFASAGLHKPNKASGQPLHSGWGGVQPPHQATPNDLPLCPCLIGWVHNNPATSSTMLAPMPQGLRQARGSWVELLRPVDPHFGAPAFSQNHRSRNTLAVTLPIGESGGEPLLKP